MIKSGSVNAANVYTAKNIEIVENEEFVPLW